MENRERTKRVGEARQSQRTGNIAYCRFNKQEEPLFKGHKVTPRECKYFMIGALFGILLSAIIVINTMIVV